MGEPAPMHPLWYLTKDGDRSCCKLFRRHYSARNQRPSQSLEPAFIGGIAWLVPVPTFRAYSFYIIALRRSSAARVPALHLPHKPLNRAASNGHSCGCSSDPLLGR